MSFWHISNEYWWDRSNPISNVNAHENVGKDTGLVDLQGRSIFKEPNEVGFGRRQDIYSVRN